MLKTDHFDIYFYPEEEASAARVGRMAERWYARLSDVFNHEMRTRQPLVLYASHPDFEQTNVIGGAIDEGTGGVTEGMKRRVVLPMAGTLAETDHVLGHELVHAFQYDIAADRVAAQGGNLSSVTGTADAHSGTAIITLADADNTIVVIPGANGMVSAEDVAGAALTKGDVAPTGRIGERRVQIVRGRGPPSVEAQVAPETEAPPPAPPTGAAGE